MNPQQILAVLEAFGVHEFAGVVTPALLSLLVINPRLSDDELTSEEDGTIKHAVRKKIGWAVDLVWPTISPYIDQTIRAAIPSAREAYAAANPL